MRILRSLILLLLTAVTLHGSGYGQTYTQAYTQVVVFGDSLSDTGNFAHLTQTAYGVRVPGPLFGYTDGRFTDGTDTSPAAQLYKGVWLEQLATNLTPVPPVKDALDGGTNYAYGGATNATGSTPFALAPGFSVSVPNVATQIATYLATKPTITAKTLFVVWGGANDLLNAGSALNATPASVAAAAIAAAQQDVTNLQTLIAAGATQFIVPNLPPLGTIPRLNSNATNAAAANAAAAAYNSALSAGVGALAVPNPSLKVYSLDVYNLFNSVLVSPAVTGFSNVIASSQSLPAVNPDTYLFWDDLHPTTYGHYLLSRQARNLLTQSATAATTLSLSATTASPSQAITLSAKAVSSLPGVTPSGLFTFYLGTTPLATAVVDGNGSASAPFTAPAAPAGYTLGVRYSGDATFTANSAQATLTVASPAYTFAASPGTVTVVHGQVGSTTLTLTPTGGLTGTYTPACGTLPAYVTCAFSPTTLTAANNTAVSTTLAFTTSVAAADIPARPGSRPGFQVFTAITLTGGLALFSRRRKAFRPALLALVALLTFAGATTVSGCGGNNNSSGSTTTGHTAAAGTYTIPVTLTPTVAGSTNTLNITLIVQ